MNLDLDLGRKVVRNLALVVSLVHKVAHKQGRNLGPKVDHNLEVGRTLRNLVVNLSQSSKFNNQRANCRSPQECKNHVSIVPKSVLCSKKRFIQSYLSLSNQQKRIR